jgi:hypothetical protein
MRPCWEPSGNEKPIPEGKFLTLLKVLSSYLMAGFVPKCVIIWIMFESFQRQNKTATRIHDVFFRECRRISLYPEGRSIESHVGNDFCSQSSGILCHVSVGSEVFMMNTNVGTHLAPTATYQGQHDFFETMARVADDWICSRFLTFTCMTEVVGDRATAFFWKSDIFSYHVLFQKSSFIFLCG